MLITYPAFASALSKTQDISQLQRYWLIFGSDAGGVSIAIDDLIQAISKLCGCSDTQTLDICKYEYQEISNNLDVLYNEFISFGLFQNIKVIVLERCHDIIGPILAKLLDNEGQPINFLIISAGELKKNSKLRQHFELKKNCAALHCYRQDSKDAIKDVIAYLKKQQVGYATNVPEMIVALAQGDKLILRQELAKLCLYKLNNDNDPIITQSDVENLLLDETSMSIDALCHAIGFGNKEAIITNIERAIFNDVNYIYLLRALQRYFSSIIEIKHTLILKPHLSIAQAISELKIMSFGKQLRLLTETAKEISYDKAIKILKMLIESEIEVKQISVCTPITLIAQQLLTHTLTL